MNDYNCCAPSNLASVSNQTPVRDYMTGNMPLPSIAEEKPMSIKELSRIQDELIDKNLSMAYTILVSLIGSFDTRDLCQDRSTIEANFHTNNDILLETNSLLNRIIAILGIQ